VEGVFDVWLRCRDSNYGSHLRGYPAARKNDSPTHTPTQMPTYSKEDYERIARAIGLTLAEVLPHENEFEAAATWYRLNIPQGERDEGPTAELRLRRDRSEESKTSDEPTNYDVPKPKTHSELRKKAEQIEAAAGKLLKHLGVSHSRDALDGPGDRDLLIFLASYSGAPEEDVIDATAQIGRLAKVLGAVRGAKLLQACTAEAIQEGDRCSELIPGGHAGDFPENEWIAAMMSLYEKITGRKAATSIIVPGRRGRGKATGPLIRFLNAAGEPLGLTYSPDSWRSRIRDNQTGGRRRK
jgi:hypothetical protein